MERFEDLVRLGIPRPVAEALAAEHGPVLLPLQQQVLEQTGLLAGAESLLVAAPTASGKTLLAELAALTHAARSRLALYLVPTRALAEQKAAEFHRRYSPFGIRVACSTRDRREQDPAILRGEVHLTVAVYEKALALLCRQPGLLARVGLIATDEIQLLGDGERGAALDLFLTRWRAIAPAARPQLVALSAVLGNPEEVAGWLGVRLLRSQVRPVPLREGVLDLASGIYRWRDGHSGESGREELLAPSGADGEADRALAAMEAMAGCHGPLIYFAATRAEALRAAFALAERRRFPPARRALRELAASEPELSRERLEALLPAGVGLHTADMPACHRLIIEQAFQSGELPLLVATPTLEQGVNLLAATVVHSPLMIDSWAGEAGRPALVPLSRARLLNQGGRAGRRGTQTGRSILLADGAFEADRLWQTHLAASPEPVRSPLGAQPLVGAIAQIAKSEYLSTVEATRHLLADSFGGRARGAEALAARLDSDLAAGEALRLWSVAPGGELALTGLGEAVARTGIAARTASAWQEFLAGCAEAANQPAMLFLLMQAEEWADWPLRLDPSDRRRNRWPMGLFERLGRGDELARRLGEHLHRAGGAPMACHRAARLTLLLDDWLGGQAIAELELEHQLPSGQMARLAGQAAWLAGAAAEVAGTVRAPEALVAGFEGLAARLAALDRALAAPMPDLDEPAPAAVVAPPLTEATDDPRPPTPQSARIEQPAVRRLRFLRESAGCIEFDGERHALTPIQYQMLLVLARRAGQVVAYSEIHQAVWPDAAVEQQMIPFHRKRLERTLGLEGGELVATHARWGLRLLLEPAQVEIGEEAREAMQQTAS